LQASGVERQSAGEDARTTAGREAGGTILGAQREGASGVVKKAGPMEGSPPMSLERHEYRLKGRAQALYLVPGLVFGGYGIFTGSGAKGGIAPPAGGNLISFISFVGQPAILGTAFILMGCYFAAFALRSRVVLDGTHISLRYAIREKSADLSEIEGWRMDQLTWSGPYWRIELKQGRGHILIMTLFQVDDSFHAFLSQLKSLGNN
jgi:hypothetical protein